MFLLILMSGNGLRDTLVLNPLTRFPLRARAFELRRFDITTAHSTLFFAGTFTLG
jgi:hypothetical protein